MNGWLYSSRLSVKSEQFFTDTIPLVFPTTVSSLVILSLSPILTYSTKSFSMGPTNIFLDSIPITFTSKPYILTQYRQPLFWNSRWQLVLWSESIVDIWASRHHRKHGCHPYHYISTYTNVFKDNDITL